MAKNIVVCSDGTGNTAIKGRGTNVFKLFEAVDLNGHRTNPDLRPQIAFYDDGVGTESFKPIKIFAGMTGFGLSRNVRQLYKEICRVYDPGDSLYLFGFSRGAFTVRTLAGMIGRCGIIDISKTPSADALESAVKRCYRCYRKRYRTTLVKSLFGEASDAALERFKSECCLGAAVPITFLGVWDTVDAVGLPFHLADVINETFYRFKFPDLRLGGAVQHACQALALDDERHSFHPLLWDESGEKGGRIDQVWFAGSHSNVGGGYPKQGMSLVALDWMLSKAKQAGLRFVETDRVYSMTHGNVDDKLYDPRAGLGVFYRWRPRDVVKACSQSSDLRASIHLSVLERIAHGTEDYAPGNIPGQARIVITETGDPDMDAAAQMRAQEVESILAASGVGTSLLDRVRPTITIGEISYYVYLFSLLAALLVACHKEGWWPSLAGLLTSPVATGLALLKRVWTTHNLLAGVTTGLVVSYLMSLNVDRRMRSEFSSFWHDQQGKLRDALKRARVLAQKKSTVLAKRPLSDE